MPAVGPQSTHRRATKHDPQERRVETLENDRDEALRRIEILEALVPQDSPDAGCCPGEWIIPTLESYWVHDDDDCPFMYRWGPFASGDTVNEAGLEFTGKIAGGESGTVVLTFPAEDRFTCDKDKDVLIIDTDETRLMGTYHIDAATGEMTVSWPI